MLQGKRIAIVGGGPGGLTLARLLQMKGLQVAVYERDKDRSVRQQGATLDLHQDSGLRALAIAGLMDAFRANFRPGADRMRVTDKDGNIRVDDHDEKPGENFEDGFFRPEIDRGPLRDLLIGSLQEDTIVWNAQFTMMQREGDGWSLCFADGSNAYADLVIAADGANSRLRPYITDIKPVYSGITIVEGNIYHAAVNAPRLHALVKGGKVFALGGGKSLILSAKGDGALSFYTGTKEAETWVKDAGIDFSDRQQVAGWFRARYSDWSSLWQELFACDDSYCIARPMYHFPLDQQWPSLPNLTMIGDAAHRMPPYAGEGVNMAMQDALELYEALCTKGFTDLQAAIGHYEKQMLERASEVTKLTLEQTEMMHAADGLENLVRMFTEPR
jgi:2-polyprenyl-6-methoxyphenol hydroxylase-like FAD-dependent oxidoreductase